MSGRVITYGFQQDFIAEIMAFIEAEYLAKGRDISRLAFVFEGDRPSIYLKKILAGRIRKSFLPPVFFDVDGFIERLSVKDRDVNKALPLEASYAIYRLSRDMCPGLTAGRGTFAEFLPWAGEILDFIDHLDMEDVSEEDMKNVQAKAGIGYEIPESINSMLAHIVTLRKAYHAALRKKKMYTRGMLYLEAARNADSSRLEEFDRIFFCNVLSFQKTQVRVVKSLFDRGKADLFFQGDQDRWPILADIAKAMSITIKPDRSAKTREPDIGIYSAFDAHSSVCMARELVKRSADHDRTVILLPDSGKVIPLLSELSSVSTGFNVSMGYPLKRSSLCSLFKAIFRAQETARNGAYYARDYLKVIMHPFAKNLDLSGDRMVTRILAHKAQEALLDPGASGLSGSLFIKPGDVIDCDEIYKSALEDIRDAGAVAGASAKGLKDVMGKLHEVLFSMWETVDDLPGFAFKAESLLDLIISKKVMDAYPLDLNVAKRIFAITAEFKHHSFKGEKFTGQEIFAIFTDMTEGARTRFSGSPLTGLQVLGLWESRLLSFDNVIALDLNESVLPKVRLYEPLIPRDIMLGLGLSKPAKEEEIQRYHFRRLIGAARNVSLIYEDNGDKEKSRFLEEIIWEKQKAAGSLDAVSVSRAEFGINVPKLREGVKKSADVAESLAKTVYSASSINMYIHCPLRFYYRYCLALKEKDDELEDIDGRDIGNFIHELLEEEFKPFIGGKPDITAVFRKKFFKQLEAKFKRELGRKMRGDAFLLLETLKYRLEKFLDNEAERAATGVKKIICLEQEYRGMINAGKQDISLRAIVDRIDAQSDGGLVVLDYKTGGEDIMPRPVNAITAEVFTRDSIRRNVKSVQLPLYIYLTRTDKSIAKAGKVTNAGLYYLRSLEIAPFLKGEAAKDIDGTIDVFMDAVKFILAEITDVKTGFEACRDDERYCANCPYTGMC